MAVAGDLEQARSALRMIAQEPFNAEAPPEALKGEITPTELHYVRSNFAVPAHDGTLEVGGAVENPSTLTLHDLRAMPAGGRAGALLHEVLEQAQPAADGVEVRFEGADRGPYHLQPVLPETKKDDLTFVRA